MESERFSLPASEGSFLQNPVEMTASKIWEKIRLIMDRIYSENPMDNRRFQEIDDRIEDCLGSMIELKVAGNFTPKIVFGIVNIINEALKSYVNNYVIHVFESFDELEGEDLNSSHVLLSSYNTKWEAYKQKNRELHNAFERMKNILLHEFMNHMLIYEFIDRLCVREASQLDKNSFIDVFKPSFLIWRNVLLAGENNLMIVNAALQLIEAERDGLEINTSLLSEVVHSYIELGELDRNDSDDGSVLSFYAEAFEKFFLEDTRHYYRQEVNFLSTNIVEIDYWTRVQQRFVQEKARVKLYLHESTEEKLITLCKNELTPKYLEDLISAFHL
ncbi:cullin-1-like [Cotesia glomerata]|uniref:cullin-1-like n=1 Tax=Cotesia glomerata TaxID=32391 RepID=UPI001D00FACB|nr:cullin-1-like [Cotesia glomerata]